MALRSICVFCGARPGHDPAHAAAAVTLGRTLAEQGIRLVYGGGAVGLMGIVADAALAAAQASAKQIPDLRPTAGRRQPLGRQDAGVRAGRATGHLLPPAHLLPLEQRLEPLHQPEWAMGRDECAGRTAGVEQAVRKMI